MLSDPSQKKASNKQPKPKRTRVSYAPNADKVKATFDQNNRKLYKKNQQSNQFEQIDDQAYKQHDDLAGVPDENKKYIRAFNNGDLNIKYNSLSSYHAQDSNNYTQIYNAEVNQHNLINQNKKSHVDLGAMDIRPGGADVDLGANRNEFYNNLSALAKQAREGNSEAIQKVYGFVHQYSMDKSPIQETVNGRIRVGAKHVGDSKRGIGLDEAYQTSMVSEWLLRSSNLRRATGTGQRVQPTAVMKNEQGGLSSYDWLDLQKNIRYPTSHVPMHTGHAYDVDDAPVTHGQDKLHLARTLMQLKSSNIISAQKRTAKSMLEMTPNKDRFVNSTGQRGKDVYGEDLTQLAGKQKHWDERLKPMRNFYKDNYLNQKLQSDGAGLQIGPDVEFASDDEGNVSQSEGAAKMYDYKKMPQTAQNHGLKIESYLNNNGAMSDESDDDTGKKMQDDGWLDDLLDSDNEHSDLFGGNWGSKISAQQQYKQSYGVDYDVLNPFNDGNFKHQDIFGDQYESLKDYDLPDPHTKSSEWNYDPFADSGDEMQGVQYSSQNNFGGSNQQNQMQNYYAPQDNFDTDQFFATEEDTKQQNENQMMQE